MPKIKVRQVHGQEMLDILYRLDNYAFHPTPPLPNRAEWDARLKAHQGGSYYALFEEGDPVAVAACPEFTQNLRGQIYQMAGFAEVSTHPKARRKGFVRELMRFAYKQLRDQGNVLSCLYPFRESFYERLGYVTFPQSRKAIFNPADLASLFQMDLEGEYELLDAKEGYDAYRGFAQAVQAGVHGMAVYQDSQKKSAVQSNRHWILRAESGGEIVGVMMYSLKGDEMMNYTLQAPHFYYKNSQGKYLLLSWIARHIDQAGKAEIWLPAFERPGTWLADIRPKPEAVFVAPMGRVLDVGAMAGFSCGSGSFTAEIVDPDCSWNNGTWTFASNQGKLEVSPGHEAACQLPIQGLSALVYGLNDPDDFPMRGWGNPDAETATVMREMFPLELPYLHEYF